jgi:chitin synthase
MASSSSRQPATTTTDDLAEINNTTEELLVSTLRDRFLKDQMYTRVRNSLLIVVNPYKDSRLEIQETSERYLAEYKNTDSKEEKLPAHIFQHVNQAYFHMRRTGSDQSIILRYTIYLFALSFPLSP